ncbi:MAG: hypothetical protein HY270_14300, partial [Deltaproteobacteria bacterium]|nr:hypothetical protein [Deltaproteobacteria bacterium]
MRTMWLSAILLVAGAILSATTQSAQAICPNLADTSNVTCKNAAKCQAEILKQSAIYINALQNEVVDAIGRSQAGTLNDSPNTRCIGGSRNGKLCDFNNGSCKSNARKNGACSSDADCDGKIGSCDRTKGCNPTDPNDTYECQIDPGEAYFSASADKARAALKSAILKKCNNHDSSGPIVAVTDLGL